jgi:hypothetical protein
MKTHQIEMTEPEICMHFHALQIFGLTIQILKQRMDPDLAANQSEEILDCYTRQLHKHIQQHPELLNPGVMSDLMDGFFKKWSGVAHPNNTEEAIDLVKEIFMNANKRAKARGN